MYGAVALDSVTTIYGRHLQITSVIYSGGTPYCDSPYCNNVPYVTALYYTVSHTNLKT